MCVAHSVEHVFAVLVTLTCSSPGLPNNVIMKLVWMQRYEPVGSPYFGIMIERPVIYQCYYLGLKQMLRAWVPYCLVFILCNIMNECNQLINVMASALFRIAAELKSERERWPYLWCGMKRLMSCLTILIIEFLDQKRLQLFRTIAICFLSMWICIECLERAMLCPK